MKKYLAFAPFLLLTCTFSLSFKSGFLTSIEGVNATDGTLFDEIQYLEDFQNPQGSQTLRLLNWEDYIYLNDEENGYTSEDLVVQFENYVKENYPQFSEVSVVYSTTDTNETMLNELATGKAHYDLICPSDYGIQRLMRENSLVKIKPRMEALGLDNYSKYGSKRMTSALNEISAINDVTGEMEYLGEYTVGYMWGTLGIIFNPEYDLYSEIDPYEMIYDMSDYSNLWSDKYYGGISLKDSIRDTYFVGLAETYKEELLEQLELYQSSQIDADTYNENISEILNRCDDETLNLVKEELLNLKNNIFGLEVDSGKQDIVTGTIGINLAWSGDSVYSMDLADEYNENQGYEPEVGLCYSVPYTGANIWFDGWCMPKDDTRSQAQEYLALLFLDFISDPVNASQNTDYIGYTSFIGGDAILDLMKDWYDIRTDYIYYYDEENDEYYDVYYYDENDEQTYVWYEDFHQEGQDLLDYDPLLYYEDEEGEHEYLTEEGKQATYNDFLVIDPEWEVVDLSYFFNDTLEEYENNVDTIFYSDCYLPFEYNGEENICVGRQFFCQFPDEETINRCVIMADFGDQNDAVRIMWEDFKANDIQPWVIVLFVIEIVLLVGFILFLIIRNNISHHLRKARRKQNK